MLGTLTKYLKTQSWLLVGKQDDPENYRPVDLTSLLSKIVEKLIQDSISREIKGRNIINVSQHSFMQNRTCQTEFISFLQIVSVVNEDSYGGIRFFVIILILYCYLSDNQTHAIQH